MDVTPERHDAPPPPDRSSLSELARLFLWLGLTSFGGPAAHVARMEIEVVEKRRWLTREELVDLIGLTQLIPGPNSTELAIHIGLRRAGLPGLLVAGACFILPAAFLVGGLGYLYSRFGALPQLSGPLSGMKPVVSAIVIEALIKLAPPTLRDHKGWALAGVSAAAAALGAPELGVVAAAGAVSLLASGTTRAMPGAALLSAPSLLLSAPASAPTAGSLFVYFTKIGSVLYGSGYVLLAFLRSGLVEDRRWLTEAQLIDATAIGQLTPGPVFTTATFIGYLLAGPAGAAASTAGIFAPAFAFVALTGPLLPRLLGSLRFRAFLDGVNAASIALLAVVSVELLRASVRGPVTLAIAAASLFALRRFKLDTTWLLLGGAIAGWLGALSARAARAARRARGAQAPRWWGQAW